MKNSALMVAAALLAVLPSCKKESVTADTFDMSVSKIQSTAIWLDVIPENNDFYYNVDAITVEEYEKYASDADFIEANYNSLLKSYNGLREIFGDKLTLSFEELMFSVGATDGRLPMLQPETDYYLFAYRLDRKKRPIKTLVKIPFRTSKTPVSDIAFALEADGTTLTVKPSNADTYYWDYALKPTIDKDYVGSVYLYVYSVIYTYYEYDFIENMLSSGDKSENMADRYTLSPGDTLQVACVGYENEESSPYSFFQVVYHGADQPTEVDSIGDWFYSDDGSAPAAVNRRICRHIDRLNMLKKDMKN